MNAYPITLNNLQISESTFLKIMVLLRGYDSVIIF